MAGDQPAYILQSDRHLMGPEVEAVRKQLREGQRVVALPPGCSLVPVVDAAPILEAPQLQPRGTTPQVVGLLCLLSFAFGAITVMLCQLLLAGPPR